MRVIMKEFVNIAKELLEVQSKIKFLKVKAQELGTNLKSICNNETTSANGYTYQMIERKGTVKYSAIPELKDLNLDNYRSDPIITWKLIYQKQYDI